MKRKIIDKLIQWKNLQDRKPLVLTGIKGVGKTYLAHDFAKAFFHKIHYLNMERNPHLSPILSARSTEGLIKTLGNYLQFNEEDDKDEDNNEDITKEKSILIIDEFRGDAASLESFLNLLQGHDIFSYIILITSEPWLLPHSDQRYHQVTVTPFDFDEFLLATSNDWYIELIETHFKSNKEIPEIVHKELLGLFSLFLQIGGMPAAINEYMTMGSNLNCSELHHYQLSYFRDTISNCYQESDALKMHQVFDSIPNQLMKPNKKFQYNLIRKGTTYSMYKEAIQQLIDHHYVIRIHKLTNQLIESLGVSNFTTTLEEAIENGFKLYLPDVGFLSTLLAKSDPDSPLRKIALLENYVAQSLKASDYPFAFWESDSIAKVDFIIKKEEEMIPIELHSSYNTRSKCISVLKQKLEFSYSMKISPKNFAFKNNVKYVPFYAVFCI